MVRMSSLKGNWKDEKGLEIGNSQAEGITWGMFWKAIVSWRYLRTERDQCD